MNKNILFSMISLILIGCLPQFTKCADTSYFDSDFSDMSQNLPRSFQEPEREVLSSKERMRFACGTTFAEFEEDFRKKYSHLPLLPIDIVNCSGPLMRPMNEEKYANLKVELMGNPELIQELGLRDFGPVVIDTDIDPALLLNHAIDPRVELPIDICDKYSPSQLEWVLLHENGHGTMPEFFGTITPIRDMVLSYVAAFWGVHKGKPYKNMATKLVSKGAATVIIPTVCVVAALRQEEKRADRFANKHASKEALRGGIEFFDRHREKLFKCEHELNCNLHRNDSSLLKKSQARLLLSVPKSVQEVLTDPIHPSIDSRVANIKEAFKTRFGAA